jgi:hypothetical protein
MIKYNLQNDNNNLKMRELLNYKLIIHLSLLT